MTELIVALGQVWTPATFTAALLAGFGMGYLVVGQVALHPTYASPATPGQVGRLVSIISVVAGIVFYVGQTVAALADSDPGWARIASRFGLWSLYALLLGVGCWIRLRNDEEDHRRRAKRRAEEELG